MSFRRRLDCAFAVATVAMIAGCSHAGSSRVQVPSMRPRPTATPFPRVIFPGHRVVAYYGAAGVPNMGILGASSPQRVLAKLLVQANAYARYGKPIIPAFELIAVVAQRAPGGGGNYSAAIDESTLREYLQIIRRVHGLLILDVQPGRSSFLPYVRDLAPLLREPDVSLALDSEWSMRSDEVPGQVIGSTDAAAVNGVATFLGGIVARYRLPQKLLVVHQFTLDMIENRSAIRVPRNLALVFHADGFGSRSGKLSKYTMIAQDRRGAYLGLKLFYDQDVQMLSAGDVMRLHPPPDLITYQ